MIDLLVLRIWIVSIPANKDRYVMDGNIQIVPSAWEGTGDIGSVYVRFYFSWERYGSIRSQKQIQS